MIDVNYRLQKHGNTSIAESINNILLMDISEKRNEIKAIENSIVFLCEKHISGVLGDEEYIRLRKVKTKMLEDAEESLEVLRKKHETSQNVVEQNDSWVDVFRQYQNLGALKREAVALFVKNVVFGADRTVDIRFVYQTKLDELNKISDNIKLEQFICSEAV